MRVTLLAILVSVLSILVFKYADHSIGGDIYPKAHNYSFG